MSERDKAELFEKVRHLPPVRPRRLALEAGLESQSSESELWGGMMMLGESTGQSGPQMPPALHSRKSSSSTLSSTCSAVSSSCMPDGNFLDFHDTDRLALQARRAPSPRRLMD